MDDKDLEKPMQNLIEAINEMTKVINKIRTEQLAKVNRPEVLYGIENINTGEITFNARSGAYQDKKAALKKIAKLGNEYRIAKYKIQA